MQQKATAPEDAQVELAAQEAGDPGRAPVPKTAERATMGPRDVRPKLSLSVTGSLSILAVLAIVALLRFAASVFIAIFSALIIAIALEPPVKLLCRAARAPRQVASVVVVALAVGALYGAFYLAYGTTREFLSDIPILADRVRTAPIVAQATKKFQRATQAIEELGRRVAPAAPASKGKLPAEVVVRDSRSWEEALFRGLGSLSTIAFSLSFIPFLVYFVLAEKESLTRRTLRLFPDEEEDKVSGILKDIEGMMQKFLVGNLIIAGILSAGTVVLFFAVGLPYSVPLGIVSGVASTIPYLGLILALVPGVLVGIVSLESGVPLAILVVGVTVLHLVAANLLTPKLVGSRTRLNAVASTISLMFFGWLWGGMGLLLAIPMTAVVKCVLENIESTRALGAWLGDGEMP